MSDPECPFVTESGVARLLASLEKETGLYFFPPVPRSSPQADRFEVVRLASEAILYSHTTIYASVRAEKPPVTLIYADFPEGVRVFGRLKSSSSGRVRIGDSVRIELETQPDGSLGYVFSPSHGV